MMHFKLFKQAPKGTTLIETLIFVAISSALLLSISSIYVSGLNTRLIIDAQQRLIHTDRFIALTLETYLTSANSITVPSSGVDSTLTVDSPVDGFTTTFALSGTDLMLTRGVQSPQLLNDWGVQVTDFTVTRLNASPDAVKIDITYSVPTGVDRTIEHQTSFTFTLHYE